MMTTQTVLTSIAPIEGQGDTSIRITFCPADALGLTEVTFDPDPTDAVALLGLVEAALARLTAYQQAFQLALSQDIEEPTQEWARG